MAYSTASAPPAPALNLLSAAQRVWKDVGPEIKASSELKEGPLLPPEELKKVCKYLQNTVTKFSASASVVSDPEEAKNALTPIAEEVIKAFTATLGTLLSISSGAGASLAKELQESGRQLTEALDALGSAVCTGHLATCAAKVLEYAASLEQSSTKNRAALMRRLLKSLSQLRDANREMQEELDGGSTAVDITSGDEELLDDEDDLVMPPMDPSERKLLEHVLCISAHFEEIVKEASTCCIQVDRLTLDDLEVLAEEVETVASAVDALAADSVGGTDVEACRSSLERLRQATPVVTAHVPQTELPGALDAAEAALLAIE